MSLKNSQLIYTIGHSNHPIETFIQLLKENEVKCLVDVRRFPSSKMHPQFNKAILLQSAQTHQIKYHWLGEHLGGFRNAGYDEFMESKIFYEGLKQLKEIGGQMCAAIMCSERLYSKCHRRFIAEKLIQDGWRVIHILERSKVAGQQGELF